MAIEIQDRTVAKPTRIAMPGAGIDSRRLALTAARFTAVGIQLLLVLALVRIYQLESRTFYHVMLLAVGAFIVHAALPRAYRLPFFAGASVAGIIVALGWSGGLSLMGAGLLLIGACHLPIRWGHRVLALAALGAVLALGRANLVPFGWNGMVWAILGSMFMFRLALYMHAIRQKQFQFNAWRTLAYFFMLPNVVFPLYPVVDYTGFEKNHYDRNSLEIYETGVQWIARGLLQLVLYRFVYQFVVPSAADVMDLTGLIQFLLGTFLLYLRVSGSFHVIVGMLYLFGFRLPETHHLYFLASGFTDFWRRINIYWKDFMMKLVYYPSFFRLRKWGTERAVIGATVIVFIATWLLHSYQWFWLRGGFPLTAQDLLFWGLLGGLVVRASRKEMKRPRQKSLAPDRWSLRRALNTVGTFLFICVLWSLWSAESVLEWIWMWRAGVNAGASDLSLLFGLLVAGVLVSGRNWGAPSQETGGLGTLIFHPAVRAAATLLLLVSLSNTERYDQQAPRMASAVSSLRSPVLNQQDAELQHRGYYEKLDNPGRLSASLWSVIAEKPTDWMNSWDTGLLRSTDDFLVWDIAPSVSSAWNDVPVSTNRWGMRDRDYTLEKPEGTYRIAFVGQSQIMGTYVRDEDVFDEVLEKKLNAQSEGVTYEMLNFGITDYSLTQQYALIESRVLQFEPDVVIFNVAPHGRARVVRHLLRAVYSGAEIPYPTLRELLQRHGLDDLDARGTPIPFAALRRLSERAGIDARTPYSEALARTRFLADSLNAWAIRETGRAVRAAGAEPILLVLGTTKGGVEWLSELDVAREEGIAVLNLLDVYEGAAVELRVAPWDNHPNAAAHAIIADRLHRELQSMRLLGTGSPQGFPNESE